MKILVQCLEYSFGVIQILYLSGKKNVFLISLSPNFFFGGAPGGLDCFYGGLFFVTSCALQLKAKCIFLCFLLCSCYASGSFWRE